MMKKCIITFEGRGSLCRKELKIQGARERENVVITRREFRVLKDDFHGGGFKAQRGLQNLMEQTMKAARRLEPEEGKDVVCECDLMVGNMSGLGRIKIGGRCSRSTLVTGGSLSCASKE